MVSNLGWWRAHRMQKCELHEVQRLDVEVISRSEAIEQEKRPVYQRRYGLLRIRKAWNTRFKQISSTKGGYWRTIPVSSELYWFLVHDLKIEKLGVAAHVFPRFWEWTKGEQARIIRAFCQANKPPSIRFYTFRRGCDGKGRKHVWEQKR